MKRSVVALMALSLTVAPLRAQSGQPLQKDPALATALSFVVPGAGQIYTEHPTKGLVYFGIAVGGGYLVSRPCTGDLATSACHSNRTIGGVVAVASWLFSMISAGDDARAYNERLRQQVTSRMPSLPADSSRYAAFTVGNHRLGERRK